MKRPASDHMETLRLSLEALTEWASASLSWAGKKSTQGCPGSQRARRKQGLLISLPNPFFPLPVCNGSSRISTGCKITHLSRALPVSSAVWCLCDWEHDMGVRSDAGNSQAFPVPRGPVAAVVPGAALNTEGSSEQRKPLWGLGGTLREKQHGSLTTTWKGRLPALTTCLSTDCSTREGASCFI